jgi:hypothetical protein
MTRKIKAVNTFALLGDNAVIVYVTDDKGRVWMMADNGDKRSDWQQLPLPDEPESEAGDE